MIQLNPLKNPLENRVTVFRVYRSVSLYVENDIIKWSNLCRKINETYNQLGGPVLSEVNQKSIFVKSPYRKKVKCYPPEFIPVMINIIKEHIK
jgi:hypothetical protein